jgi:hypothetical protein
MISTSGDADRTTAHVAGRIGPETAVIYRMPMTLGKTTVESTATAFA